MQALRRDKNSNTDQTLLNVTRQVSGELYYDAAPKYDVVAQWAGLSVRVGLFSVHTYC